MSLESEAFMRALRNRLATAALTPPTGATVLPFVEQAARVGATNAARARAAAVVQVGAEGNRVVVQLRGPGAPVARAGIRAALRDLLPAARARVRAEAQRRLQGL